jgi:hypothetical protein
MSTRSRIGLQLEDGSVLSAYAHWDGYPEWMGRILRTHFNSKEKVAELIDGGDMSSPWTTSRWTRDGATEVAEYGPEYYSGRGEDCPPRLDSCLADYLADGEEYAYVFTENGWQCYNRNAFDYRKGCELVEIPEGALAQ